MLQWHHVCQALHRQTHELSACPSTPTCSCAVGTGPSAATAAALSGTLAALAGRCAPVGAMRAACAAFTWALMPSAPHARAGHRRRPIVDCIMRKQPYRHDARSIDNMHVSHSEVRDLVQYAFVQQSGLRWICRAEVPQRAATSCACLNLTAQRWCSPSCQGHCHTSGRLC